MASKRDKIRLISTAGTGHFYTTDKRQEEHAGQDGDQEIRSRRAQARGVQRSEDQVIPPHLKNSASRRVFLPAFRPARYRTTGARSCW